MDITEEMLKAFEAGWVDHDCGPGDCCTRSALARVAPLIAAQALRQAAEELRPEAERAEADGDPFQIEYAGGIRYAIGRLAACPTCSGPRRETVGMVCRTCGTDYAR